MAPDFGETEESAAGKLIELALAEDLDDGGDLTSQALIAESRRATIALVARCPGILAGLPVVQMVFERLDPNVYSESKITDGSRLQTGTQIADISGPLRSLLTGERTALNFLTHLSGVATLTRRFVDAVAGTRAQILDTRKTLPGWRVLEKYAVRAGGGTNHRLGLYDGVLIKDNHLAAWCESKKGATVADAVRQARQRVGAGIPIAVEVDTLEQLGDALHASPERVLLDNMDIDVLRDAVEMRNGLAPAVELEASGGVTRETVAGIAATGVEFISVGALTHSAAALDLAFDWEVH